MYIPLEDGETIVAQVHKHWWFIFLRIIALVLLMITPLLAYAVTQYFNLVILTSASTAGLITLGLLWLLLGWVIFWQFWTLYYMDMWVVTNKRLIDIDYLGFFDRNIAILRLDKIQDVTVKVSDFFGTILGYGSLVVETAAADKEFVVEQIANPEQLRDIISKLAGDIAERMRVVKLEK